MTKAIQNVSLKKLKSIMLIDDNEVDNFINQKILESCGATNILTFESTTDALNYLKQTVEAPQLILLDRYLPIMNGFEFMDELEKLEIVKQPINVFILSASINPQDIKMALEKKCTGYIKKPLTTEKILKLLETINNDKTKTSSTLKTN